MAVGGAQRNANCRLVFMCSSVASDAFRCSGAVLFSTADGAEHKSSAASQGHTGNGEHPLLAAE